MESRFFYLAIIRTPKSRVKDVTSVASSRSLLGGVHHFCTGGRDETTY